MEEWRDIKGYEGKYKISSYGKVKSLKYKDEKLLRPSYDKDGYKQVILYNNGKGKKWFIHRLVAIHFLPNPNNLPQVNHKDEDKANNAVENLEWCTCKYNINYGTAKSAGRHPITGEKLVWKYL